jgi:hypothetical protein
VDKNKDGSQKNLTFLTSEVMECLQIAKNDENMVVHSTINPT